jgi:hypothetical protein
MDNDPRSGRQPVDFPDIQILAYLETQSFHSTYSLAKILNVSHATIVNDSRYSLSMKLFHLRRIRHELTDDLRAIRMKKCQELLPLRERMEADKFRNIITGGES